MKVATTKQAREIWEWLYELERIQKENFAKKLAAKEAKDAAE